MRSVDRQQGRFHRHVVCDDVIAVFFILSPNLIDVVMPHGTRCPVEEKWVIIS